MYYNSSCKGASAASVRPSIGRTIHSRTVVAGPKGSLRQPKSLVFLTLVHRLVHRYITRVIYLWLVLRAIECVVSRSILELEFFFLFQSLKKKFV